MNTFYRNLFLIINFSLFISNIEAQNFSWARRIGGGDNFGDHGYSINSDTKGNIYTIGFFSGTVDFDPGPNNFNMTSIGNLSAYILKVDSASNFIWAKNIGVSAYTFTLDTSANLYITGNFAGTTDFDPNAGIYNLTAVNNADVFILKLNSMGNFEWVKTMGGTSNEYAFAITLDTAGNIYTTGMFSGTCDFNPGTANYPLTALGGGDNFISKLDPNGNFLWAKNIGGTYNDIGYSIATDSSSNVYISGVFQGTVDFDPGTGTNNLTSASLTGVDIFILKLNASGNFIWARKMGGTSSDYGYSMAIDKQGNVYTTGIFSGTADFDPGSGIYNLFTSNTSAFVSKIDYLGNFVWAKSFPGYGQSMAMDSFGDLYLTGQFTGSSDFDPGTGTFNMTSNGDYDITILKLNNSGGFIWAKHIGGTYDDRGSWISVDAKGRIYITGYFNLTPDFDPGTPNYFLTSEGLSDIFILKLCSPPIIKPIISGLSSVCAGVTQTFSVAPVPFATAYQWTVPLGTKINSGQNTSTINVTFGINSGYITVLPINYCANGLTDSFMVIVNQLPIIDISVFPDTIICAGDSVKLNGTGAINYSWSGGINDGTPFILNSTKTFKVIGTDGNGCSNIDSVTIFVNNLPSVTSNPIDQSIIVGSYALFTVKSSSSDVTYQWQQNSGGGFVNLFNAGQYSGVNNDSLVILNINFSQTNNEYRCILTKGNCSVTSNNAKLLVKCISTIQKNPNSIMVQSGRSTKFIIIPTNANTNFQWQLDFGIGFVNLINNNKYSGATKDTLQMSSITVLENNFKFRCILNDGFCSDTSSIALLTVCDLGIQIQPTNLVTEINNNVLFHVQSSIQNATYQWQQSTGLGFINLYNAGQFYGTTTNNLTIMNVTLSQNGNYYRCILKNNSCSDTSNSAMLKVCYIPILNQPVNRSVIPDSNVFFIVSSSATTATYQWQENTGNGFNNILNSGQYSGATNDTLSISNVKLIQNNYKFHCIVNVDNCSDTTRDAILNVGIVGISDYEKGNKIIISPNPFTDKLKIILESGINEIPFIISDELGRKVYSGILNNSINEIDLQSLSAGFYFLTVIDTKKSTFKLMKK